MLSNRKAKETLLNVKHDPEKKRFFLEKDGFEAELTYKEINSDTWDFNSTFTPPELRGQGLAGQVTQVSLDTAREMNKKVLPSCPYVKSYIERHPEYKDLL